MPDIRGQSHTSNEKKYWIQVVDVGDSKLTFSGRCKFPVATEKTTVVSERGRPKHSFETKITRFDQKNLTNILLRS